MRFEWGANSPLSKRSVIVQTSSVQHRQQEGHLWGTKTQWTWLIKWKLQRETSHHLHGCVVLSKPSSCIRVNSLLMEYSLLWVEPFVFKSRLSVNVQIACPRVWATIWALWKVSKQSTQGVETNNSLPCFSVRERDFTLSQPLPPPAPALLLTCPSVWWSDTNILLLFFLFVSW